MGWNNPPTVVTGDVAPSTLWNTYVRDNLMATMHLLAPKTADQAVTSSTTKVNDNHLLYAVSANEVWQFVCWVVFDATTASDLRFGFNFPSGRGIVMAHCRSGAGGFDQQFQDSGAAATTVEAGVASGEGAGLRVLMPVWLNFACGGSGGTVNFAWAQGTSGGTATNVFTNSALFGARVSP